MISSLIVGAMLLLLLMVLATKGWLALRDLHEPIPERSGDDGTEPCTEEFLSRIFSRDDWDFVRTVKAASIERLFEQERKKVALVWVRETATMIRKVMRGHAEAARQSKNLEVSMEMNLLTQYLLLMGVCGILSIAIQIAGPLWLGGLAHFAQRLSIRIAGLQESFEANLMAKASDPIA